MSCLRRQLLKEYTISCARDVRDRSFASICRGELMSVFGDTRKYCATHLSIGRHAVRAAKMMLRVSDDLGAEVVRNRLHHLMSHVGDVR